MTKRESFPKISIVIPAYNEEVTIEKCLRSMIEQNFELPYEVILVNNNSTDRTREIAASIPGVKVIDEKLKGVASARQAGFEAARADIIASMDADGYAPSDWLANIWEIMNSDKELIGVGGYAFFMIILWQILPM